MTTNTPVLQNYEDDRTTLNDMTPTIMVNKTNNTARQNDSKNLRFKNNNDEIDDNKTINDDPRIDVSENLDHSSKLILKFDKNYLDIVLNNDHDDCDHVDDEVDNDGVRLAVPEESKDNTESDFEEEDDDNVNDLEEQDSNQGFAHLKFLQLLMNKSMSTSKKNIHDHF
jgi:hypothetical protein